MLSKHVDNILANNYYKRTSTIVELNNLTNTNS